jgi:ketosteroid isomerase-like protein
MQDRMLIEKTLRQAYAARMRGDVDEISRLFAPDACFVMAGEKLEGSPASRCLGLPAIRSNIEGLVKVFEMKDHQIVNMLIDGQRAAVHWRVHIRSTLNGLEKTTDLFDLVEFKDGQIVSFLEFCDTALGQRMVAQ